MPSSASSLPIPPDALDLLRAFCAREVRFLIVGAHALGFWAQPRATGDLDLFVEPSAENAARVLSALNDFGVPPTDLSEARPGDSRRGLSDGAASPSHRSHTEQTGISFAEAWEERAVARPVPVSTCRSSAAPR